MHLITTSQIFLQTFQTESSLGTQHMKITNATAITRIIFHPIVKILLIHTACEMKVSFITCEKNSILQEHFAGRHHNMTCDLPSHVDAVSEKSLISMDGTADYCVEFL